MDRVVTGTPFAFRIGDLADLPATLLAGRREGSGDVLLVIEIEPPEWETADLGMLFHLGWDVRNPGEVSAQRSVQLELRLDREVAGDFPAGDVVAVLVASEADAVWRRTDAWFALEVTEAIETPPGLPAGDLRSGFTTTWNV